MSDQVETFSDSEIAEASKSIVNFIRSRDNSKDWNTFFDKFPARLIHHMLMREECVSLAFRNYRYDIWNLKLFITAFSHREIELAYDLINSSDDDVVEAAFYLGLYKELSKIDVLVKSSNENIRHIASQFCSIETLKDLKKDPSAKVRKVVFSRLGPSECLDDMLSDKMSEIRGEGIRLSPFGYDGLSKMTGEIAYNPFRELVDKISIDYLPMLLGNRNVKNNTIIADKINKRMSAFSGGKDE